MPERVASGRLLPELIQIETLCPHTRLTIDGVEFPWVLAAPPVPSPGTPEEMPRVTLELLADRVEFVNDLQMPARVVGTGD